MFMESSPDPLTKEARFFLEPPPLPTVEGISFRLVSERFGYTPGSFRVLCHHFRRSQPDFFRDLKLRGVPLSFRERSMS
jgi:hypothetical protein